MGREIGSATVEKYLEGLEQNVQAAADKLKKACLGIPTNTSQEQPTQANSATQRGYEVREGVVYKDGQRLNVGESVVDFRKSVGAPSDFQSRKSDYESRFGGENYKGTTEQNTHLLETDRTEHQQRQEAALREENQRKLDSQARQQADAKRARQNSREPDPTGFVDRPERPQKESRPMREIEPGKFRNWEPTHGGPHHME